LEAPKWHYRTARGSQLRIPFLNEMSYNRSMKPAVFLTFVCIVAGGIPTVRSATPVEVPKTSPPMTPTLQLGPMPAFHLDPLIPADLTLAPTTPSVPFAPPPELLHEIRTYRITPPLAPPEGPVWEITPRLYLLHASDL